ncbi:MAG: hypothetical protein Q4C03_03140 [bacterium]|nr:hypothetical protein [bacterium]MDO5463035.1 hypothetical protein [bacterium]
MKKTLLKSLTFALLLVAMPVMAAVSPASGVIHLVGGGETKGKEIRWLPSAKKYTVRTDKMSTEVQADEVDHLEIKRPKELDKAIKEKDVTVLKEISEAYNNLQHDIEAASHLCDIYNEKGQYDDVIKLVEGKARNDETLEYQGPLAARYWTALIEKGKGSELERQLKKALDSEDDESKAAAYVARGNLAMKKGSNAVNCREALTQGYLRVILLYANPSSEAYAEALYRGGQAFVGMGHVATKNELYKTLRSKCKNSKWAKLAK